MRSVDNIFIVADIGRLSFITSNDKETDLKSVYNYYIVSNLNERWRKILDAWKYVTRFMGKLYPTIEEYIAAKEQILLIKTEVLEILYDSLIYKINKTSHFKSSLRIREQNITFYVKIFYTFMIKYTHNSFRFNVLTMRLHFY